MNTYTKTTFVNGQAPAVSAEQLNKLGQGIEDVDRKPWVPVLDANAPLSQINEGQIWRLQGYSDPYAFNMKLNGERYFIDLNSLLKRYQTGIRQYTGILLNGNSFPLSYTTEIGTQPTGNTNSISITTSYVRFTYAVEANIAASVFCRMSFGVFDFSVVRRVDVTFKKSSGGDNSNNFRVAIDTSVSGGTNIGILSPSSKTMDNVGNSYVTMSLDTSKFLGIGEIYIRSGTAYSSSSSASSLTIDISKVELIPM